MVDDGSPTLCEQHIIVPKELTDLNHMSRVDLAQKAKIQWGIEGDENSGYFHGTINRKRRQMAICDVFRDGVWVDESILVKEEFSVYYQSLFLNHRGNHSKTKASLF